MSLQTLSGLVNKRKFANWQAKKFVRLPGSQLPQYSDSEDNDNNRVKKKLCKRATPSASSEISSAQTDDEEDIYDYESPKSFQVKTIIDSVDDEKRVNRNEDDGFVVKDGVVELFEHAFPIDKDDDDDKITAEEKAARIIVFDKEVDQKESAFEGVAIDFERRSHLKKMEKGATELGLLMASLFFCTEGYDEFIVKFDELMLNKTLVCFKANVRSATIFAAQGQNVWKCKPLDGKKAAKCFLCGYHRVACRNCLFTTKDNCPIGYLGDECAIRWKLVERVFALRKEILSKMGCCDNKAVKIYETKIAKLNEICIRTLRELHNKWAQTDENRIED